MLIEFEIGNQTNETRVTVLRILTLLLKVICQECGESLRLNLEETSTCKGAILKNRKTQFSEDTQILKILVQFQIQKTLMRIQVQGNSFLRIRYIQTPRTWDEYFLTEIKIMILGSIDILFDKNTTNFSENNSMNLKEVALEDTIDYLQIKLLKSSQNIMSLNKTTQTTNHQLRRIIFHNHQWFILIGTFKTIKAVVAAIAAAIMLILQSLIIFREAILLTLRPQ